MTEAFRHFCFAEVGEGQWIGEESIFSQDKVPYTLKAKTQLKVLEIYL